jgi:hypothetical protein
VLIMDVDPFRADTLFHPDAIYRLNIDSDGDGQMRRSGFLFSPPENGEQSATGFYATGSQAGDPEPSEEVLSTATGSAGSAMARSGQTGCPRTAT